MSLTGNYEHLRRYLREFTSIRDEPVPYDVGGVVHLLLALVDNLHENALPEDIVQYGETLTAGQANVLSSLLAAHRAE